MYLGTKGNQLNSEDFSDEPELDEQESAETENGLAVFDRGSVDDDEVISEIEAETEAESEQDEIEADIAESVRQPVTAQRRPRPTRAEERSLVVRVQNGEAGSADALLERYKGFLIDHISKKYSAWPMSSDDKLTCARLGLIRAAEKFDLTRDTGLTTYAAWWIRAKFSEVVERDGLVGGKIVKRGRKARREEAAVERANFVGGSVWISSGDVSLDAPIAGDDDGEARDGHDIHSDNGEWAEWVENALDAAARTVALNRAQEVLTWRERYVFRARFINPPETYRDIGNKLGFSGERARQIEAKALEKIALEVGRWRGYLSGRHFSSIGFGARPEQVSVPNYREYVRRLHNQWPKWPSRVLRPGELTGSRPTRCYSTQRLAWFERSSARPRSE